MVRQLEGPLGQSIYRWVLRFVPSLPRFMRRLSASVSCLTSFKTHVSQGFRLTAQCLVALISISRAHVLTHSLNRQSGRQRDAGRFFDETRHFRAAKRSLIETSSSRSHVIRRGVKSSRDLRVFSPTPDPLTSGVIAACRQQTEPPASRSGP